MAEQDIALMAHLLRRAGFGASHNENEASSSLPTAIGRRASASQGMALASLTYPLLSVWTRTGTFTWRTGEITVSRS